MSRLSKAVENMQNKTEKTVTNFMGGECYTLDPVETLRMIAASSVFGEPSYYRNDIRDGIFVPESGIITDGILAAYDGKSTTEIFTEAIDTALEYDFGAVLEMAAELRSTYNMRLNPQVIMVRAALHPARKEWTEKNPGKFAEIQAKVMQRADEPAVQATYYLYTNKGSKEKMPSVLKRSISARLSALGRYQVNKYKNAEIGMINTVRLVHANSPVIDELMRTGTVEVGETEQTWEQKRSAGMSWADILRATKLGHMAMLRNIVNVFTEIDDTEVCREYMEEVKNGVPDGRQFPFRYESAYRTVKKAQDIHHQQYILDALEECMDIAVGNLPHLKGRTMCLSDNSGSAWGCFNSEYGTVTVANIDNLSAVIAAKCSDEGYVGKFGDELRIFPVSKRNGTLSQAREIDANGYRDVGGSTEGGIWKFFRNAIRKKAHYDNIFIFSDQQAGTGGLYGTAADKEEYTGEYSFGADFRPRNGFTRPGYINVYKLIQEYRRKVNPRVNVFSVQTAGYNNVLVPQMSYRCAMLTGWTGKEISFAADYIAQWDAVEAARQ
ncbi:MAG: hypothetical protein J5501_07650 [Ruminococcus sp.]|nr:hypothetical protein [Ruminococcus sp.]